MIQTETLVLCILILQTLLLVMRVVVFFGRFRDGIAQWTVAGTIEVAMWVIIIALGKLSPALVGHIALCGFVIGISCLLLSLCKFFSAPDNPTLTYAPVAIALVAVALGYYEADLASLLLNLMLAVQSARCVLIILSNPQEGIHRSCYLLMLGFAIFSLTAIGRAGRIWIPDGAAGDSIRQASVMLSLMSAFVTGILINIGLLLLHQDRAWHEHRRLAMSDPLTGLLNRRALELAAEREVDRARRQKSPLFVAMLDIDYFKKLNDTLGHQQGDQALKLFAQVVQSQIRKTDVLARYGGEEFCLILPAGSEDSTLKILQRVRDELESTPLEPYNAVLRFSAGVSVWYPGESNIDLAIARSDAALYQAKQQGRNQTAVALSALNIASTFKTATM